MQDEIAVALIERGEGITDKTKTGIINIDTLSQYFQDGETVTLSEIKKRVKGFSPKITYIKVLARGTLDKRLTVEADDFSLQAVKMIVLTGGKAVKV
ncbi:MAG: uL15 family ribosomal protein [Clostridia bacterium]|nr:uL15 family ribosomal protein [Clostridia bacterium]